MEALVGRQWIPLLRWEISPCTEMSCSSASFMPAVARVWNCTTREALEPNSSRAGGSFCSRGPSDTGFSSAGAINQEDRPLAGQISPRGRLCNEAQWRTAGGVCSRSIRRVRDEYRQTWVEYQEVTLSDNSRRLQWVSYPNPLASLYVYCSVLNMLYHRVSATHMSFGETPNSSRPPSVPRRSQWTGGSLMPFVSALGRRP